ncbi:hypothetical protein Taro_037839 [Colocasia esculenta]|uniref:Uncharacterized protein n=1 Tax=Colocasia esculenta TaxID=4460 RepID=A0A843W559_COLES|nr:hypothetical protein [Colocasia esculenta]
MESRLASAIDRRRQLVKNQKAEDSDCVHLSTGALLLSTGVGLLELLIFGLVASVDRSSSSNPPVQPPEIRSEEVRIEVPVVEQEQVQAPVSSQEQEILEETINQVLRDLRGKGVAQEEEIPSFIPVEPSFEEYHHVSPPHVETRPRSQRETRTNMNNVVELIMKQHEMMSVLQMQVQKMDVKFDFMSEQTEEDTYTHEDGNDQE